MWAAVLPALLVPVFLFVRAVLQFGAFASASGISDAPPAKSNILDCVVVYSITPHTSEFYVREFGGFATQRPKNAPTELSTVLRGMAKNECGDPLKFVKLNFVVHDDKGQKGQGIITIDSLVNGEAKQFEKAWMGRVTSWEVTASK
jgi:hypothetical protein